MKHILVPTDFSSAAKNAYFFALEIAKSKGLPVHLVNCYLPEVDPAFPYLSINSKEFLDARNDQIRRFKQHTQAPHDGGVLTGVEVTSEIRPGYPSQEILKLSEDPEVEMIVMGATGEHGLAGQVFGSVSTHLSRQAKCPVLLVPNGANYHGFKHILFASSFESVQDSVLQALKDLATLFKASIHFVHVHEQGSIADYRALEEHIFDFFFAEENPSFSFTLEVIEAEQVVQGLNDYAKEAKIDLTIMVAPKRSFWDNILHRSKTKSIALTTQIPLLVYHV